MRPRLGPLAAGIAPAPSRLRRPDVAAAPPVCSCAGTYSAPTSAIANATTKTLRSEHLAPGVWRCESLATSKSSSSGILRYCSSQSILSTNTRVLTLARQAHLLRLVGDKSPDHSLTV